MTRRDLYIQAIAAAFSATPPEHRRAAWADLESLFLAEYRRAHPIATTEAATESFLDLARSISARMSSRPILTLRRP